MKKTLIYILIIGLLVAIGAFFLSTMKYELKMMGTAIKMGFVFAIIILIILLLIKLKISSIKKQKAKEKEAAAEEANDIEA